MIETYCWRKRYYSSIVHCRINHLLLRGTAAMQSALKSGNVVKVFIIMDGNYIKLTDRINCMKDNAVCK